MQGDPELLFHAHVLRLDPAFELPIEGVYERTQHPMQHLQGQRQARTYAPPAAEWGELKMLSLHIDIGPQESLRREYVRVFPDARVSSYSPQIQKNLRFLWDGETPDLGFQSRFARKAERNRGVHPECLLCDGLQVGKVSDVRFFYGFPFADDSIELSLRSGQLLGTVE